MALARHGNSRTLSALSGSPTYGTDPLFSIRDCGDDEWRVIELLTDPNQTGPWQAKLEWGAGDAGVQTVELVVPRMARTCIRASSLRVWAANLSSSAVTAFVAISTAVAAVPTENVFEVRGETSVGVNVRVPIPLWAKAWRFETQGAAALAAMTLNVNDGAGVQRNSLLGTAQPSGGWSPVGDATEIEIVPAAAANYRVLFLLHL